MIFPMQYLRMLTNSLIAGALVGAYVALLVLQLNPMVRLDSMAVARLVMTWAAFYGIHATAFFYALIVIRQLIAVEVRSPGWISLRLLAAFGTIAVSMSALVTWLNLDGFHSVLGPAAAERMIDGALVVSLCAALCVALSLLQARLQRDRGIAATMFGLVLAASLVVPVYLRGPGEPTPPGRTPVAAQLAPAESSARVHMILLDGASLDFIAPNAAGGRFPNFGHLLDSGAVMHLATLRPTQPAPVWTAVSTGKLPYKTSVYSAARYVVPGSDQPLDLLPDFCFAQALLRLGLIEEEGRASDAVRARPIWELLSGYGITAGVIDWPLTYPAHGVNGYLISDEFLHRDAASLIASAGEPLLAYPPDAAEEARVARDTVSPGPASIVFTARPQPAPGVRPREGQVTPAHALAADVVAEQIAGSLSDLRPVQFTAIRYPGIDAIGHYYLRYALPRAFGDVSDEERLRHGRVLEQYYTYLDGIVGRAMASLGPDDLLLVVSGFGMEPLSLGKRLLERVMGDPELSGSHERAPDGFVMAYGRQVSKGNFLRASVVDIAPTVLYYFGLPIARDLDGFARTDIFTRSFTEQRPITFIPFYDR
ncbi:MAG TPA: alkaline phosphatase family protein [Vicinamibacterales bacterium]|nr:alkaline phosphatase family protein [Vicinamibacterales bacterium]